MGSMDAGQQPIVTNHRWLGLGAEQLVESIVTWLAGLACDSYNVIHHTFVNYL